MGAKEVLSPDDAATKFGIALWLAVAAIAAIFGGWELGALIVGAGVLIWACCLLVLLVVGRRGRRALWDAARYVFGWAQWIS
jgi:hypothetical protein